MSENYELKYKLIKARNCIKRAKSHADEINNMLLDGKLDTNLGTKAQQLVNTLGIYLDGTRDDENIRNHKRVNEI